MFLVQPPALSALAREEEFSYISLDAEGRTTSGKVFCVTSGSGFFLCPHLDMTQDIMEEKSSQGNQSALT